MYRICILNTKGVIGERVYSLASLATNNILEYMKFYAEKKEYVQAIMYWKDAFIIEVNNQNLLK